MRDVVVQAGMHLALIGPEKKGQQPYVPRH